jgi:hypothetical protein
LDATNSSDMTIQFNRITSECQATSCSKLIMPPTIKIASPRTPLITSRNRAVTTTTTTNAATTKTTTANKTLKEAMITNASATTTDVIGDKTIVPKVLERDIPPKTLFPWKHETHLDQLSLRLQPGTIEHEKDFEHKTLPPELISYLFLNMPFYQLFFNKNQWKQNLADSCAYAFTHGMSHVLSNVYSLSTNDVLNNDDNMKIQFNFPPSSSIFNVDHTMSENDTKEDESNHRNGSALSTANDSKEEKINLAPPPYNDHEDKNNSNDNIRLDMFSKSLQNLYQSAYTYGKDRYQVKLQTEPVLASLHHIHMYPCITREAHERNPEIVKDFLKAARTSIMELHKLLLEHCGNQYALHDYFETTVDLQVAIQCQELFQVIDRETGIIVQGSNDGLIKPVYHLIRFETNVVTTINQNFPYNTTSTLKNNWMITDIDDLITTKSWFSL